MDLGKVPNEKKLNLCRWYFRIGFALLPFVWTVNVIWFFNEAFRKPEYEEQKHIKKYVILSAVGSTIWLVILITWITIFQLNRANWGAFADNISFIIPSPAFAVLPLGILNEFLGEQTFLRLKFP